MNSKINAICTFVQNKRQVRIYVIKVGKYEINNPQKEYYVQKNTRVKGQPCQQLRVND